LSFFFSARNATYIPVNDIIIQKRDLTAGLFKNTCPELHTSRHNLRLLACLENPLAAESDHFDIGRKISKQKEHHLKHKKSSKYSKDATHTGHLACLLRHYL
jgi:hypothetical protein